MESFQGPFFSHLKKSGQHLPVSAPQALPFTKISPRPLTGSRVWISKLADDDSEVLQQSFHIQPQGLFYSCTQCWVSVLCWSIASDVFSLRTMSLMEKDGAQKESWEVLLQVVTSHIISPAPSRGHSFISPLRLCPTGRKSLLSEWVFTASSVVPEPFYWSLITFGKPQLTYFYFPRSYCKPPQSFQASQVWEQIPWHPCL